MTRRQQIIASINLDGLTMTQAIERTDRLATWSIRSPQVAKKQEHDTHLPEVTAIAYNSYNEPVFERSGSWSECNKFEQGTRRNSEIAFVKFSTMHDWRNVFGYTSA